MISFKELFDRNDPDTFIPYDAARFIKAVQLSAVSDSAYEQMRKRFTASDMLLNPEMRESLLNGLRENECNALLQHLEVKVRACSDPYTTLERTLKKGSKEIFTKLFEFLNVDGSALNDFFIQSNVSDKDYEPTKIAHPLRQLFPHQREALKKLEEQFFRNSMQRYRGFLHMPTGSGKTRTASMMACRYLLRYEDGLVIWLADTQELCEQAFEELEKSWSAHGDRDIFVHRAYNSIKPDWSSVHSGILVMGLQTANTLSQKVLNQLSTHEPLVIFDEAHKTIADTYEKTVMNLVPFDPSGTKSRLLGLSATPGRSTFDFESNQRLASTYDHFIVSLNVDGYNNPVDYLIDNGYLAKPKFESLKTNFDFAECCRLLNVALDVNKQISTKKLQQIGEKMAQDKERNAVIFERTLGLINEGHQRILVFASSVEQSKRLAFMFRYFGFDARSIDADSSEQERNYAIKNFKISRKEIPKAKILCNYQILTTGFDAPETSAVVIARPTNSLVLYSQMVGRALRGEKAGGNKEATVVTIVDNNVPSFWDVSKAFVHWNENW